MIYCAGNYDETADTDNKRVPCHLPAIWNVWFSSTGGLYVSLCNICLARDLKTFHGTIAAVSQITRLP